jgi:hypothetical protein
MSDADVNVCVRVCLSCVDCQCVKFASILKCTYNS